MLQVNVVDLCLEQIQMINYQISGLQETLLGFGTIIVQTYVGDLIIRDVHHPARIQKKMVHILRELGENKNGKMLIGFAAETDEMIANATKKLSGKNLDMIVANNVAEAGSGFDGDTNIATILDRRGASFALPLMSKDELANRILDHYLTLKHHL
jgi:phosphopantothenoylcysteine synthetase/decarboxylase